MADTRDIEASRLEFEAQMRAAGYRDDRHDTGEYVGVTSYRWEGWIAALASRPAEVDDEGLLDAAEAMLEVLDGYPEQLVPINRKSSTVRYLRNAVAVDRARREKGGA